MPDTPPKPIHVLTPFPKGKEAPPQKNLIVPLRPFVSVIAPPKAAPETIEDKNAALKKHFTDRHNFINAIYTLTTRIAQHKFSRKADLFITDLTDAIFTRSDHKIFETLTHVLVFYSRYLDFLVVNKDTSTPFVEKTLLDALVATMLVSVKITISDKSQKFHTLITNAYKASLYQFYDYIKNKLDAADTSFSEFIRKVAWGLLSTKEMHSRFSSILIDCEQHIEEEEYLHAQVPLLIEMCGYMELPILKKIEKAFLTSMQWRVAILCSEEEIYDFMTQFRDYTNGPIEDDDNTPCVAIDVMAKFERTLKMFGRESEESTDGVENINAYEMAEDVKSVSLMYEFGRMKLGGQETEDMPPIAPSAIPNRL